MSDNTHQQAKRYAEIATQAIMNSLGYKMGDEPIQRALDLQGDALFAEIIRGVAAGMKLRYLGIHESYGVLLAADGRGPFASSLGWLNKRLLPEITGEQLSKERKEQRLFAGLTLIALLAELFPTPDTVRVEFGQSSAINAASVVARLNDVADQVIAQRKVEGDDTVDGLLTVARFVQEERIPRIHDEKVGRVSSIRSQTEMATRWIQLLQEEGFLAEDSSLSGESDWYPTQKLKHYLRHTGIEETVRFVTSISPATEDRSLDLVESDIAALVGTPRFPPVNERPAPTGTSDTQRLLEI
ncbi:MULTISPECIES: hypothetical protein [Brenneria]|uniref:Uncharacterized protein n=1 Tax=Brenneria nigrifluens DSM 30175 = ATCC 13028 TaxID=1121120 RepID=A0A2U1URI4_9GAMM|nr:MULTISPECIES: hypothetical protein [Brenneria]EHD23192.1 hypothetical protein BrE312_3850 [Brenneria sp. EniD312]PWC24280.1 hypothetical protein DDT54_10530 [Brenneria nigrifluens DSM 30175 = ATCC 13028]QCR06071.1 hypothetical protein EH206_19010 [Brenneria nigrifluens DSM 30175 = ATCC 13028]